MLLGQRGAGGGCSPPVRHKHSQFQLGKGAQALGGGKARGCSHLGSLVLAAEQLLQEFGDYWD